MAIGSGTNQTMPSGEAYMDFVYDHWSAQNSWSSIDDGGEASLVLQARHYFWREYQTKIEAALKQWQDQGWEPVETVGPEAIALVKRVEKIRGPDASHFLLWCITLGVAF